MSRATTTSLTMSWSVERVYVRTHQLSRAALLPWIKTMSILKGKVTFLAECDMKSRSLVTWREYHNEEQEFNTHKYVNITRHFHTALRRSVYRLECSSRKHHEEAESCVPQTTLSTLLNVVRSFFFLSSIKSSTQKHVSFSALSRFTSRSNTWSQLNIVP